MKHLKLFEEYTSQLEIPFSDKEIHNNQELIKLAGKDNIVHESKNFIVVKPRNFDDVKIITGLPNNGVFATIKVRGYAVDIRHNRKVYSQTKIFEIVR